MYENTNGDLAGLDEGMSGLPHQIAKPAGSCDVEICRGNTEGHDSSLAQPFDLGDDGRELSTNHCAK